MTLPSLVEKELIQKGQQVIIGVDEAGRGPWAGPVVAAAVWLPQKGKNRACDVALHKIADSKRITEKVRKELFDLILEEGKYGLGVASPYWIDKLNILGATFRAMRKAVNELGKSMAEEIEYVLVDGNLKIPYLRYTQKTVIKGDFSERLIAAASIVAKVNRDRLMEKIDRKYPQYGFASHKGYGTIEHREALKRFGLCPLHRQSFKLTKYIQKD